MSGIEVAGIVLGAIPLVISGLEHYSEGARTIRSMRDYPKEFATLSRRLRVENETFRNTMELVLSGFVGDGTLSDMLTQPGGQAWTETRIEQELHRTLQGSHAVFLETVVDMNRALVTFMERLRLDTDGKGPFNNPKSFHEAYKRFRFALKRSAYMDLVDEISKDNTALSRLAQQSSTLELTRSRRKRPSTNSIRATASSMFASLQKAIHSSCKSAHTASLYVKAMGKNAQVNERPEEYAGGEAFRIVLHHTTTAAGKASSWLYKETEIRLKSVTVGDTGTKAPLSTKKAARSKVRFVDDGSPPTQTKPVSLLDNPQPAAMVSEIRDLCDSILSIQASDCGVCQGYLVDAPKLLQFGIFRPKTPIVDTDSLDMLSLGEILSSKTNGRRLSVASRRRLAASLALGLLCLHDTPWLASHWGHKEITFFCKGGNVLDEHPFVSTSLGTQITGSDKVPYFTKSAAIANESMFALGILLIELCLHQSLEELLSPAELNPDGTKHAASEYLAALRLIDIIDDKASWKYGDAIRHCIQRPVNQGIASLDNESFREAMYDNVVAVLEEEASRFSRL